MAIEMVESHAEQSGWFDWLQHEKSLVPEGAEDLVVTSVGVLQLNGRFLYLKRTTDLADFIGGERRIAEDVHVSPACPPAFEQASSK